MEHVQRSDVSCVVEGQVENRKWMTTGMITLYWALCLTIRFISEQLALILFIAAAAKWEAPTRLPISYGATPDRGKWIFAPPGFISALHSGLIYVLHWILAPIRNTGMITSWKRILESRSDDSESVTELLLHPPVPNPLANMSRAKQNQMMKARK